MEYKLSICVVTMNRAKQLKEALESCLACELPSETEFVVIDNASTDNTAEIVNQVLSTSGFDYQYERMSKNIGAGSGRNVYFSRARGAYIFGMDDDAIIDGKDPLFFVKAIDKLDNNGNIGSMATQIYDEAWGNNRQKIRGSEISPGVYKCKMFCGGSHFLRKVSFGTPPYLPNQYGYEELPPSLLIMDAGMINAFCPDLLVIHKPAINKWDVSYSDNQKLLVNECAIPYAIKRRMYPKIFWPVLKMAVAIRIHKYLQDIPNGKEMFLEKAKEIETEYSDLKRIKTMTVLRMFCWFGLSVF